MKHFAWDKSDFYDVVRSRRLPPAAKAPVHCCAAERDDHSLQEGNSARVTFWPTGADRALPAKWLHDMYGEGKLGTDPDAPILRAIGRADRLARLAAPGSDAAAALEAAAQHAAAIAAAAAAATEVRAEHKRAARELANVAQVASAGLGDVREVLERAWGCSIGDEEWAELFPPRPIFSQPPGFNAHATGTSSGDSDGSSGAQPCIGPRSCDPAPPPLQNGSPASPDGCCSGGAPPPGTGPRCATEPPRATGADLGEASGQPASAVADARSDEQCTKPLFPARLLPLSDSSDQGLDDNNGAGSDEVGSGQAPAADERRRKRESPVGSEGGRVAPPSERRGRRLAGQHFNLRQPACPTLAAPTPLEPAAVKPPGCGAEADASGCKTGSPLLHPTLVEALRRRPLPKGRPARQFKTFKVDGGYLPGGKLPARAPGAGELANTVTRCALICQNAGTPLTLAAVAPLAAAYAIGGGGGRGESFGRFEFPGLMFVQFGEESSAAEPAVLLLRGDHGARVAFPRSNTTELELRRSTSDQLWWHPPQTLVASEATRARLSRRREGVEEVWGKEELRLLLQCAALGRRSQALPVRCAAAVARLSEDAGVVRGAPPFRGDWVLELFAGFNDLLEAHATAAAEGCPPDLACRAAADEGAKTAAQMMAEVLLEGIYADQDVLQHVRSIPSSSLTGPTNLETAAPSAVAAAAAVVAEVDEAAGEHSSEEGDGARRMALWHCGQAAHRTGKNETVRPPATRSSRAKARRRAAEVWKEDENGVIDLTQ